MVGLSDEEASRLAEGTGGWPAPLRLLALLIQDHEPSAFINAFAGAQRPVVEYLTTDVLELLEPDVQDFVLKVSILTRMCGALCDAVVGRSGSGTLLAELERASLFISVDRAGDWYSQHHLFAEAMRLELARTQPELLPTLHRRAARWFEETGDLESAADHAIESRDVALAARLVAAQVESLAARGRWATVRGWLAELSWPAALADPELAWVRATSDAFGHDLDGAERWLDVASSGAPEAMGSLGLPLGFRVEMLRALVGVNDVARGEEAAYRALEIAPGPMWQGAALAALGQAQYLRGATTEARDTLRKAVALIPDAHPNLLVLAIGNYALAEYADGDASHASPMLDRATEMMATQPQTVTSAILHMALGERARQGGDPRGAVGWFESAIADLRCTQTQCVACERLPAQRVRLPRTRRRHQRGLVPRRGRRHPRHAPEPWRPGEPVGRPAPAGQLGHADLDGVRRRALRPRDRGAPARRSGTHPARDRRSALHLLQHRQVAPEVDLPQARGDLTGRRPGPVGRPPIRRSDLEDVDVSTPPSS